MARADYIYLIENSAHTIEAAFTVRHEMLAYLRRNGLLEEGWNGIRVYRMPDNPAEPDDRVYYTQEELVKMGRKAA